jgi:ATP-dependent Clp protease ATP-binding subunit ClpA
MAKASPKTRLKILIKTSLPVFGYELAAALEAKKVGTISVEVDDEVDSFELRHKPSLAASKVAEFLKILAPFQPELISADEELKDADVELSISDEGWLPGRNVTLFCDSDNFAHTLKETLTGLGMTVVDDNRWALDEDVLLYKEAPVFGRQLIRWILLREGIELKPREQDAWETSIGIVARDPAEAGKPWRERARIRIRCDDNDAGETLLEQLTEQGYQCHPLEKLPKAEADTAEIKFICGALNETRASADFARVHVLLQDLVGEQKINAQRYPIRVDTTSRDLDATILLPLKACRGRKKRPYGGPEPKRFRVTILSDNSEGCEGLKKRLNDAGFDQIEVQAQPSILNEEKPEPGAPLKLTEKRLDGYKVTWGAAGNYPEVATAICEAIKAEMKATGVEEAFTLQVGPPGNDADSTVEIYFPMEGRDDGRLMKARVDPSRFNVKLHSSNPDDWGDLAAELSTWGFGNFEVVPMKSGPSDIHHGGAPKELLDRLVAFIHDRTGINLGTSKVWDDTDADVFFFLPQRKPTGQPSEGSKAPGAGWRGSEQRRLAVAKLESYGRTLTSVDLSGRGRTANEATFRKLVTTLSKMKRRNVIIVGHPGTGKTALVYELARRMQAADPSLPERLRDLDIFELSPTFLRSGAMFVGQYEQRVAELLKVLQANPKIILFIDEIHSMFQSGRHERTPYTDAQESFKGALARGDITVIGCTTYGEYRHSIEPDEAMARRFEIIRLEPPTTEDTLAILAARKPRLEEHYAPLRISDAMLKRTVELTEEHLPSRFQPDKSIQLLDQACALCVTSEPPLPEITEESLYQSLEASTGNKLVRAQALTREEVSRRLRERVVGQDAVLEQIAQAFVAGMGAWHDRKGPRGVFLFAGPTGVGKTETALALAEILGGGHDALIRIDCNTLQGGGGARPATSQLLGVAAGFIGYVRGQGGLLSRIRDRPESVVLFDEFEKADRSVGELLLQVIDHGRVEDVDGNLLDFRRAFLVFTTNAGTSYDAPGRFGFAAAQKDAAAGPRVDLEALKAELRDRVGLGEEFLGRITHFFAFQGLGPDVIDRILRIQIEQLGDLARTRGFEMEWSPELVGYLTAQWQPRFGVRHLTAILRNRISEQLGVAEAQGELRGIKRIRLRRMAPVAGQAPMPTGTAIRQREGDVLVIDVA